MNCCDARHYNLTTNETSYCLVVSASTEITDEEEEEEDEGDDNDEEQEQDQVHYARAGGGWIGLLRCQVRRGIFSKTV